MHIIYKTTNLINGKFYIGKHTLNKRSKHYLGSGHALKAAIKKYGRENFIRETLFEFESLEDCIAKEAELVNSELTYDPMCYNIITGGIGGQTHHNDTKKQISKSIKQHWANNPEKRRNEQIRQKKLVTDGKAGVASWTDKSKQIVSEKAKKRWQDPEYKAKTSQSISNSLTGRKLSKEHIEASRNGQNKTKFCIHCQKVHKLAAYGRWHGDKCKEKPDAAA